MREKKQQSQEFTLLSDYESSNDEEQEGSKSIKEQVSTKVFDR